MPASLWFSTAAVRWGFGATPVIHDIIEAAAASPEHPNQRAAFALKEPVRGFVRANDYLPPRS